MRGIGTVVTIVIRLRVGANFRWIGTSGAPFVWAGRAGKGGWPKIGLAASFAEDAAALVLWRTSQRQTYDWN